MGAKRLQRYAGHQLREDPHIAVIGSCKVGNFVVTLPLLRLIRKHYPKAIVDFWGSEATEDFEKALCGPEQPLNWRCSWDLEDPEQFLRLANAAKEREKIAGPIDLAINCDGFNPLTQTLTCWLKPFWVAGGSLNNHGRKKVPWGEEANQKFLADNDWNSNEFYERYKNNFHSNYIAELLCRMAYFTPELLDLEETHLPSIAPDFEVPSLLIHCTTTRSAKIWPFKQWNHVLKWCQANEVTVGIVGAPPKQQADEYHSGGEEEKLIQKHKNYLIDLRGKTSLITLAGACKKAKAVLSVDAGPMHIAVGVGTPTLAIVGNDKDDIGASPIRLWLPRNKNLSRTISSNTCEECQINHFKNDGCIANEHLCMKGVSSKQVIDWLEDILVDKLNQMTTVQQAEGA